MNEFLAHSEKQESLILSETEKTIAATGTQWGKSTAAALWLKRQIHLSNDSTANFLLMAPTYKVMNQSMIPYFLQVMEGCGRLRKSEAIFELSDGRICYMRTAKDPNSIVGIPKVTAYWADEAGLLSLYFHENILARAASVGARGLYTTSPYSRNWLYRDYIKPAAHGEIPGLTLIQAASWENPYHTLSDPEKRAKMKAEMDPRRFEMLFGGQWGKQSGLVYDCFEDSRNICPAFRLPNGTEYFAGVDWGHTEPFAIVVRAITPEGLHFQVSEFYKSGMTILEQIRAAKQKMNIFNIRHFYCGHERPENILLFNQNGLPASPVPEKDIQVGTDLHYELIKTRRYKVFENSSPYTIDEYETYHYPEPEELETDEDSKDQLPVGQADHCMSANRFVTLKTFRSHLLHKPFVPEGAVERAYRSETQEARFKRLRTPKSKSRERSENWS